MENLKNSAINFLFEKIWVKIFTLILTPAVTFFLLFKSIYPILFDPAIIFVIFLIVISATLIIITLIGNYLEKQKGCKKFNKIDEWPDTYIEFTLKTQATNNCVQSSLISKSNIAKFKFSNIEKNIQSGYFFDLMMETIEPIEHYILDIEPLNTKLQPAVKSIFCNKYTLVVRIEGDIDITEGKYKMLAKKSLDYNKS